MKIGLYGGSFDPKVHLGHLLVACRARRGIRPGAAVLHPRRAIACLSRDCKPTSGEDRGAPAAPGARGKNLVRSRRAGAGRGGVSHTIDTVRDYHGRFPGAEIFYLIGGDHVQKSPLWREAEELGAAGGVRGGPAPRPGRHPVSETVSRGAHSKGFPLGVSSSQIRERIKAGEPIDHLVPATVAGSDSRGGALSNDE